MIILIRPKKILIGKSSDTAYNWTGILRVEYEESSPWVHIDIPGGVMVHQHIRSPHIEGVITCIDLEKLETALYTTVIDSYNHTAISTTDFYTKWSVDYLKIVTVNDAGAEVILSVDGFRVERVEIENIELGTETRFRVHFTCDRILFE